MVSSLGTIIEVTRYFKTIYSDKIFVNLPYLLFTGAVNELFLMQAPLIKS